MVKMKKAYFKDCIKMFKNNLIRFISIVLILILGSAFFISMNAVSPVMEKTAREYLKDQNVYDISLVSSLGYTKEDMSRFNENESIKEIQGVYTYDALTKYDNRDIVIRAISDNHEIDINNNNIFEGRDIQNDNECLVSSRICDMYGYEIGDKIKIYRTDDSRIEDNLAFSEFEIVGTTRIPIYISKFYGNSSLLSGELHAYMVIREAVFNMDNFAALYIKTTVDNNIDKFSDEYKEKIEEILPEIQDINKSIIDEKYNKIYKEAYEGISTGEEEIRIAEKSLKDSKEQIKSAQLQLNSRIRDISYYVAQHYNTIALFSNVSEKNDKIYNLYLTKEELTNRKKELEEKYSDLKYQVSNTEEELIKIENNIDKNLYDIYSLNNEEAKYVELSKKVNGLYYQYNKKNEIFENIDKEFKDVSNELTNTIKNLEDIEGQIDNSQRELYDAFSALQYLIVGMNNPQISYSAELINNGKIELDNQYTKLRESNAEAKINEYKAEINEKKDQLNQFNVLSEQTPLYDNSGFKSLKDDLEKIAIMGRIFPVLFFIVAALVTITTITRMIEEDRKNIGILKALGYNKKKIMNRYILYALFAAILGVILGAFIGSSVIIRVLYVSYCSLYDLPDMAFSVNMLYTFIALLISLISTVFVTIVITIKSLNENAANLMRPKSAKEGKNILLERIPFLWKRFSFLTKICFRNIFRYKRRLFMTLIGIAGCTALIYAGLGLQSAINDIGQKQFGDIRKFYLEVYFQREMSKEEAKEIEEHLEKQSNIKESIVVKQKTLTIEVDDNSKDVFYMVADGNEFNKYISLQERKTTEKVELNDNGIVLTEKLAGILDVKEQDKVNIIDDGVNTSVKVSRYYRKLFI